MSAPNWHTSSILCGTFVFVVATSVLFSFRREIRSDFLLGILTMTLTLGLESMFMVYSLNRAAAYRRRILDRFIAAPILFGLMLSVTFGVGRYLCERLKEPVWHGEYALEPIVETVIATWATVIGGFVGAFAEWLFWRPRRGDHS